MFLSLMSIYVNLTFVLLIILRSGLWPKIRYNERTNEKLYSVNSVDLGIILCHIFPLFMAEFEYFSLDSP